MKGIQCEESLEIEQKILRKLNQNTTQGKKVYLKRIGFPKIIAESCLEKQNWIAMEKLGMSLQSLIINRRKILSTTTVLLIGIQLVKFV